MKSYYTIRDSGSHEVIIQKSRFIGYVKRVHSEQEAQQFIQEIKKKHYDATHNCSAYIVGDQDQFQKANDDGEPSGTAGIPMLEVLKRLSLKNTVVVVTRYFGGIKLGAGGLIRAYSTVTSETIKKVGIVKGDLMQGYSVLITYPLLGKVQNHLKGSSFIIENINYLDNVELNVYVPIDQTDFFIDELTNLTNGQIKINESDQKFVETDVELN